MSIIANTQTTYDIRGIRENLTDVIYNISPTETPFMQSAGRASATATLYEWQTDSLASADGANAQLDGDDITSFAAAASTIRVGNYCQISRKLAIVSGTTDVVNRAGRKTEMAYQLAKRSAEIKRDMETILLRSQGGVAGNTSTARTLAALPAWVKTNTDKGATGADPNWTSGVPATANVRTDGTQRAFTETILKNVIQLCWTAGGEPDTVMLGASQKQTASGFSGVATKTFYTDKVKTTAIIGAADVYVSDFGTLNIIPNRFQRSRDGWVLNFDYVAVAYLRPFRTVDLAKTGDAEKKMLLAEYTLQVKNEAALGICADLT